MAEAVELGIAGIVDAREVGRGGFAVVYKAHQPAFDREVAVKILRVTPDERSLARFQREVRAMGKLSEHPAIATVLDAGTTDRGEPYLLMPYLSGGSLQDALDGGLTMGGREVAEIGVNLAGALAAAHDEGILHRDIKPANVMLGRYGDPLLVDFGIARIAGGHQTTSGVVTATLDHAAPELLDGKPPSVASDIYSLGSTLFALAHGKPAHHLDTDESVVPMIRRILTEPLPDLREDGVPDVIAEVIELAMAKSPQDRFPTATAMADALREALDGRAPARPAAPPTGTTEPGQPTAEHAPPAPPVTQAEASPSGPNRRLLLLGAVAATVTVAVVALVLLLGGEEQPDETDGETATDQVVADDVGDAEEAGGPLEGVALGGVDETELQRLSSPVSAEQVEVGTIMEIELPEQGSVGLTFAVDAPSALRASTSSIDPVDPIVGLYADGQLLAADDDGSGGLEIGLDHPHLAPGSYELRLAALSGPGVVSLSLQVPEIQPLTEPAENQLGDIHEVHAYVVDVLPGVSTGVRVSTPDDVRLVAYQQDGQPVGTIVEGTGELPLDLVAGGPGPVVVMVSPLAEGAQYLIEPLTRSAPVAAQPPVSVALDGVDLPGPDRVDRQVGVAGVTRVELADAEVVGIPFAVGPGEVVRVLARSPDGTVDPIAMVYDAGGVLLAASDDEGGGVSGQDPVIDLAPPPGEYIAVVSSLSGEGAGPLDLLVELGQPEPLRDIDGGVVAGADLPVFYSLEVRSGLPPPPLVQVEADVDLSLRLVDRGGGLVVATEEGGNPPLSIGQLPDGGYLLVVTADEAVEFRFVR